MTESDWSGLRRLYLGAKRYYTETTDLDQIEAQFPADLIAQAIMVGYHDILPYAAPLEVSLNGRSWLFDDQYCVRQLHFTHSRLEMKRERSCQLNCRKPPLGFRCVITTTAAMSKYFQIRVTRRRLDGN